MFAVIETGGKQFKVSEGDIIYVEKIGLNAGDSVVFDRVLAVVNGAEVTAGTPAVEGARVEGKVIKNGKSRKIMIFKYNAKKNYRRRQGHRQPFTKVQIDKILV
jgi:large subunit ribosomal protein L21